MNGAWDWEQVMKKYRFNLALMPVEHPVAQLLKQRPEWRVVADDGKHILFVLAMARRLANGGPPEWRIAAQSRTARQGLN